jgi:hypothetical protein
VSHLVVYMKMIVFNQKVIGWSDLRVANTKVHIWHASLQQPLEVVQKLEAVLSEEERQRAERFRFKEHRHSFIVSRGILRDLLSRYTGIQPGHIRFKYNLAGKPFLANEEAVQDIYFNLSHAGKLVLYAFSWGRQVGIDVECVRPMEEMDRLAERIFPLANMTGSERSAKRTDEGHSITAGPRRRHSSRRSEKAFLSHCVKWRYRLKWMCPRNLLPFLEAGRRPNAGPCIT